MAYQDPAAGAAREAEQSAAVADIANTATATAEDVGDKVNELLGALRTAGLVAGP